MANVEAHITGTVWKVEVKVFCGPCQKKKCPLDHRCMVRVTPGMVYEQAVGLLPNGGTRMTGAVLQKVQ